MKVEVLGTSPKPQQMITWVARFSHRSHDKASPEADAKLFAALYRRRHWSVFEFNRWTVRVMFDSLREKREALIWLADHRGWNLTPLSCDSWVLSGNARSLLEDIENELAFNVLYEVSNEPGWLWLRNINWWAEMSDVFKWQDFYIYDPKLNLEPFERAKHAAALFVFRDISRVCAAQMLRHRLCSFMQESLRYVEPEDAIFLVPDSVVMAGKEPSFSYWGNRCFEHYSVLLGKGVPKEDARYILPLGTTTTLVIMASLREWAHIIKLRTSKAAQWEIREKMEWARDVLLEHVPWFREVLDEEK